MYIEKDAEDLFEWYKEKFYDSKAPGTVSLDKVFKRLRTFQNRYNRVAHTPCRGIKFSKMGRGQYCGQPLCPSCWHLRHVNIMKELKKLHTWEGHFYIRSTWQTFWAKDLHPKVLQRFKVRRADSKMLFYALNYDSSTFGEISQDDVRGDEFMGQISYSVTGVFYSKKPQKEYGMDHAGQVHVYDEEDNIVGIIHRKEVDPDLIYHEWLKHLNHPWLYRAHRVFDLYLENFYPKCLGKSWSRINKAYFKE